MHTPPISKDSDTDRLLDIVIWNLTRFFGYDNAAAVGLVRSWYPNRDDDFYHHEGAFRSAAFIHYSTTQDGSRNFFEWFRAQHFDEAEREALEHYRGHYFQKH
jgi:hypothetical protein